MVPSIASREYGSLARLPLGSDERVEVSAFDYEFAVATNAGSFELATRDGGVECSGLNRGVPPGRLCVEETQGVEPGGIERASSALCTHNEYILQRLRSVF